MTEEANLTEEQIDAIEQDKEALIEVTMNGETAKQFLNHPFGQYLMGCAIQEKDKALGKLMDADVHDVKLMQEIKEGVRTPLLLGEFITRAIEAGDNAILEYAQKYMEK